MPRHLPCFIRIALLAVNFSFVCAVVPADRIEYSDGRVMEGHIVRVDDDFVVIQDGTADFKIPRSLVTRIVKGTEADKWLRSAKAKLSSGDSEGGIQDLAGAVDHGVSPESLAAVMVRFSHEIAEAIPALPVPRREELQRALHTIQSARLPRQETLILTQIRLHLEFGNLETATPLIETLEREYPDLFEENRASLADWFERNVDSFLDAGRYDDALDYLVQLRRMDPDRAGDKRILLVLQWGRRERDQGHYEKALDVYANQLLDQSPEIGRNRIIDALEQAEYRDRQAGTLGRSITLYERYGLEYVPDVARRKLVELWNEFGFQELHRQRLDEARKAFERVDQLKPGSAASGYLQLEHAERAAHMDRDDPLAYYELGEWSMANGLWIEARQAFLEAAETDALRTSAKAQLEFIENTLNEQELNRLLGLYEDGAYLDVLNGIHAFKGRPLSRGFRSQAEQLEQLTQDAIRLTVAERPQQAEVLWQQAERAFHMRDYPKAQSLLRALIERYSDTPAGVRGEEFLRRNRSSLSLYQMETAPAGTLRRSGGSNDEGGGSALAEEIRRLRSDSSAGGSTSVGVSSPEPRG